MRTIIFNTKSFDREALDAANGGRHELVFVEAALDERTATLARGCPALCAFVNDRLPRVVLETLAAGGTRFVALRSAGFNHVDLEAAAELGFTVARVPAYSPHAVAEHTVGLMLTLNRKFHRAYSRVREGNFALEGLMGFDMRAKTVGVVGTGTIGVVVTAILRGFGCHVLGADPRPNEAFLERGGRYVELDELLERSEILTLHCPLTPATHHLIDAAALAAMPRGVMLINTSRGAVVDTRALIAALKSGQVGAVGLDVYEEEGDLFFRDLSQVVIQDDVFARLLTFPNVLITAHQAFFTREAVRNIAETTVANLDGFEAGQVPRERLVDRSLVAS